jgi:hypothetical protein
MTNTEAHMTNAEAKTYVVTFERLAVRHSSQLVGLRRMSLKDANALMILAASVGKEGRILDASAY